MSERFDVEAVNIATGARRYLARNKDHANAQAIVDMAVLRRGVGEDFYRLVPCPVATSDSENRDA